MHKSISSFLMAISLLAGVSAAAAPADNAALLDTRWVLQSLDGRRRAACHLNDEWAGVGRGGA